VHGGTTNYYLNKILMEEGVFETVKAYLYEKAPAVKTDETIESTASILQDTVAGWYKSLRAIALVGLLSVLVYVGIRMIISSTGESKAKYKKMLIDWIVAMCILFVLQYIMSAVFFTLPSENGESRPAASSLSAKLSCFEPLLISASYSLSPSPEAPVLVLSAKKMSRDTRAEVTYDST
jgi:hypothetical protein